MHQPRRLRLTASILLYFVLQTWGADKYTDENRPYEFGFEIPGQQHRHESKDKDGIIMGEFGFVTADDVYHVTVYATDKEGRFKILSMKNIHLKSSPASSLQGPTSARKSKTFGNALAFPTVQASVVPQRPSQPNKPISIEKPRGSCSSCSLPTTTTQASPPAYNQVTGNNNYNSLNQFDAPGTDYQNQPIFPPYGPQNISPGGSSNSQYRPELGRPELVQTNPQGLNQFDAPGTDYQNQPIIPPYEPQNISPGGPSNSQYRPELGRPELVQTNPRGLNQFDAPGTDYQNQPIIPPYEPQNISPGGPSNSQYRPELGRPELVQTNPGGLNQFDAPGTDYQNQPIFPPYGPQNISPGGSSNSQYRPELGRPELVQTNPGGGLFGGNKPPYTGSDAGNFPNGNVQQANQPGPIPGSYTPGGERTSKQLNGLRQPFDSQLGPNGPRGPVVNQGQHPAKPTLVTAQMQIVNKNTDIYKLGPNEQRGLPPGLNQGDITTLLYTFNYTVGFHGHFEEGYTNGVKKGYYFVTGRNGVRTRIDYTADDTGFHPTISQDVLDLLSEDVPKPETEKDEKYGLKGYEFKWLFYPVEPKRR